MFDVFEVFTVFKVFEVFDIFEIFEVFEVLEVLIVIVFDRLRYTRAYQMALVSVEGGASARHSQRSVMRRWASARKWYRSALNVGQGSPMAWVGVGGGHEIASSIDISGDGTIIVCSRELPSSTKARIPYRSRRHPPWFCCEYMCTYACIYIYIYIS